MAVTGIFESTIQKGGEKIRIYKTILENSNVCAEGLMAHCAVQMAYGAQKGYLLVNRQFLAIQLCGRSDAKALEKSVAIGIENLLQAGIYELVKRCKGGADIIRPLPVAGRYFVLVQDNEVQKLAASANGFAARLLRYYLLMLGTINNSASAPVGFRTIEALAKLSGYAPSTVIRYTKLLEELKLLYVNRCSDFYVTGAGLVSGIANTYGRYIDKELVKANALAFTAQRGTQGRRKATAASNGRRAAAQKYNAWRKGKKYSVQELEDTYRVLLEQNRQYENSWPARVKDLTPFAGYAFYES